MLVILLATIIGFLYTVESSHRENRKIELSRITKYELIHITPEQVGDVKIMDFTVFDTHYKVELVRNDAMHPDKTRHTNIDKKKHLTRQQTESCHYHGRVLNAADDTSIVSVSLCEGRGIRGRITAFNETLIISPSAYYMDFDKDVLQNYDISDELLVYRLSDFKKPGKGIHGAIQIENDDLTFKKNNDLTPRRLAYTASNPATTEIAVVNGPVRVNIYKDSYGDKWYQTLYDDTKDMIAAVSAIYMNTNWGSGVGPTNSISIVFAEIEIIHSFTGIYADLPPNKLYTNCQLPSKVYDDSDDCAVNGQAWLGVIKNWVAQYKDTSTFDNVQFVTDMKFKWSGNQWSKSRTLGWGYIGTVCSGASSTSDVSVVADWGYNTAAVRTMAHELGHNFGLSHDGQSGPASDCAANEGLMGYSDGEGFSRCSIRSMQEYFSRANGLTCIGRGWDGNVKTNHDGEIATPQPTQPTPRPTTKSPTTLSPTSKSPTTKSPTKRPTDAGQTPAPTTKAPTTKSPTTKAPTTKAPTTKSPTSENAGCLAIDGLDDYFYDGEWPESSQTYKNKAVYEYYNTRSGSQYYMFYKDDVYVSGVTSSPSPSWYIGETIGGNWFFAVCPQEDVFACSGQWYRYRNGAWARYPGSIVNTNCGAEKGTDTSCGGYTCVSITGVPGYSGEWSPGKDCYNNERVYELGGNFLCYSDSWNRWTITTEVCSPYTGKLKALSGSTGSTLAGQGWYLPSATKEGSYSWSRSVMVSICGGNAEFNIDDLACLENMKYKDSVCVYSNNTIWNGHRTFDVYDQFCRNDEPVYQYQILGNASNAAVLGTGSNIKSTYYLHFHLKKKYSDSNETVGQWLISKDEISVNAIAICEQDNLLDCTANQWVIELSEVQNANEDDGNSVIGGILLSITDKFLNIKDGECESDKAVSDDDDDGGNGSLIIILVVIILIIILVIVGYCIWKKMNSNETQKIRTTLGKRKGKASFDHGGDGDEPEIEVSMEREANQTFTNQ